MSVLNRLPLRFLCFAPLVLAVAVLSATVLSATVASAGTLEIQFTGLDLTYDGTNIFDSGVHNTTGTGNPADADALTSMNFYLDGNLVGVQSTNVFADLYIKNVLNIPVGGGVVVSGGNGNTFGIDLLTQNSTPGYGLALNIDTMQFFYTGFQIGISVSGLATEVFAQSLPFGLQFDITQPVTIVMSSANLTGLTSAQGFLTGFHATGTGNVAGTGIQVPEPGTVAMLGVGLIGLVACGRRRLRRS